MDEARGVKRPKEASGKGNRPLEYSPLHQSFKAADFGGGGGV